MRINAVPHWNGPVCAKPIPKGEGGRTRRELKDSSCWRRTRGVVVPTESNTHAHAGQTRCRPASPRSVPAMPRVRRTDCRRRARSPRRLHRGRSSAPPRSARRTRGRRARHPRSWVRSRRRHRRRDRGRSSSDCQWSPRPSCPPGRSPCHRSRHRRCLDRQYRMPPERRSRSRGGATRTTTSARPGPSHREGFGWSAPAAGLPAPARPPPWGSARPRFHPRNRIRCSPRRRGFQRPKCSYSRHLYLLSLGCGTPRARPASGSLEIG